jgi:hypothetical protein
VAGVGRPPQAAARLARGNCIASTRRDGTITGLRDAHCDLWRPIGSLGNKPRGGHVNIALERRKPPTGATPLRDRVAASTYGGGGARPGYRLSP